MRGATARTADVKQPSMIVLDTDWPLVAGQTLGPLLHLLRCEPWSQLELWWDWMATK